MFKGLARIKLVSNLLAFAYVSHDAAQVVSYIVGYYYWVFFCQKASGVGNESPTIKRHAMLILSPCGAPAKRVRGGYHQRIAAREEPSSSAAGSGSQGPPTGALNLNLIKRWAKGTLSAKDVQDIAYDAMIQFQEMGGEGPSGMERFAEFGGQWETSPKSVQGDAACSGVSRGSPRDGLV